MAVFLYKRAKLCFRTCFLFFCFLRLVFKNALNAASEIAGMFSDIIFVYFLHHKLPTRKGKVGYFYELQGVPIVSIIDEKHFTTLFAINAQNTVKVTSNLVNNENKTIRNSLNRKYITLQNCKIIEQ